jgi:integrase
MPRPRKEGTDYEQRDGIWYAWYWDDVAGKRRRRSTGTRSREEAEVEQATWRQQRRSPQQAAASHPRLANVLALYEVHARDKRLTSAAAAGYAIQRLLEYYGDCAIDALTAERQNGFIDAMVAEDLSDGYIRRTIAILSKSINLALEQQVLPLAPKIKQVDEGDARVRWLRPQEAARLVDAAVEPHVRLFIVLGLLTGQRPAAILELDWHRVDLAQRFIDFVVTGRKRRGRDVKREKARVVLRISNELATVLDREQQAARDAWRAGRRSHPLVISYDDRPVSSVRTGFYEARRRARLGDDVTPYTLRHTFASWAVQRGVPLIEVAKALGHRDTRMVEKHYVHLDPEHTANAVAAVGGAYAAAAGAATGAAGFSTSFLPASPLNGPDHEAKSLNSLVEPRGVEPLTSTMPLYGPSRQPIDFSKPRRPK